MKKLSVLFILCSICFSCEDTLDLKATNENHVTTYGTVPSVGEVELVDRYRWYRLSDLNMSSPGANPGYGHLFKVNGNAYCRRLFWEIGEPSTEKTYKFNKSTKKWDLYPISFAEFGRNLTYLFSYGNFMFGVDYENDLVMFNVLTGQFQSRAPFPGEGVFHASAVRIGTDAYVLGGMQYGGDHVWGLDQYWKYDIARDRWTNMGSLPGGGRGYASAFAVGSKIYFGLGMTSEHQSVWDPYTYSNQWLEIDPATNNFTWKASLPSGIGSAKGFVMNDKVYVGWGSDEDEAPTKFWQYRPTSDRWTEKPNPGISGDVEAFSIDDKGYAMSFDNEQFWQYSDVPIVVPVP